MAPSSRLGPYDLIMEIARGGMGTVHLARKRGAAGVERLVVVKRMHAHLATDPEFRSMLVQEARLTSLVRHPNVVPALDVIDDGGELALVLEYVEAVSLSALQRAARGQGRTLDLPVASRVICDTLAGLHAAHEACDLAGRPLGIVHRDVSPQNVLCGVDGVARLIDFGVAKAAEQSHVTRTGVLKGKLRYMAPEQVRHKDVDRRVDVFACGAVLYEVLCGRPAFAADTEAATLLALLVGEVPPPTSPDGSPLPEAASGVLARALSIEPSERFATAAEFRDALTEAIPPAREAEVEAVVRATLGDALEARRRAVATWISGTPSADDERPRNVDASSATTAADGGPPAHRGRIALAAASVIAVMVAAATWMSRAHTAVTLTPPSVTAALTASPSSAPPPISVPESADVPDAGPGPSKVHVIPRARGQGTPAPSGRRPVLHDNPYQ